MPKLPKPKILKSWNALRKEYERNKDNWDGWLFRGQKPEKHYPDSPLKTSLERTMIRFGEPLTNAREVEGWLLRDFMRRCHLVTAQLPSPDDKMEWLALLRHYGGPARLSDWTYSFWIAVHFA